MAVRGRMLATSDADIAIMPGRSLDLLAEAGLADRLAQALGVPAVDLRRALLRVRGRVLVEGPLLFSADEPGRVALEVRTPQRVLRLPAGPAGTP